MHSISRRGFLSRLSGGIGYLTACGLARGKATYRPNILVIYTDDQGYGDFSAMNPGSKFRTPNLDRLARQGVIFTDAHCPDTVCTPSRYGLLTGRYSWRTRLKQGVMGAEGNCLITKGRMTLPSLLKEHGYSTGMIGKWHLGMKFAGTIGNRDWSQPVKDGPVEKGFDSFYGIPASMNYGVLTYIENDRVTVPPTLWTTKKPSDIAIDDFRFTPPYSKTRERLSIEIAPNFDDEEALTIFTNKAMEWIANHGSRAGDGKPFFLYLAYTAPHKPVCPMERFRGKSKAGGYGDFMMETDYHVGQVLETLEKHGLRDNTLIVLTSDNGPETTYRKRAQIYHHYSAGDLRGGKRDIYEGGHRVPFIVRWPGVVQPGRRLNDPICQTDLLATFADMLGRKLPDNAGEDSFSLLPALTGERYPRPLRGPIIHHSAAGYFAIREGRWKLNMFRGSGGSLAPRLIEPKPGEPPFELYDMDNDHRETSNVYGQHPDIVARLKARITKIVTEGRSTPGKAQRNDGPAQWPQLTWMEKRTQTDN
jgi:arylsulfatase A